MKDKFTIILSILIFIFVGAGVYLNILEQEKTDRSKLPQKVELSNGFQRWITNLKNKDINIEADEFKLVEKNEIYNTKWMTVYSLDDPQVKEQYDTTIQSMKGIKKVVFSPSKREFIDYRNEIRGDYQANQIHFYGQKEDKLIDARILDCSTRANCYFDRGYFLDNDVFVISEFSRNIDKKDTTTPLCSPDTTCTYSIKIHVIDLVNNSRYVYESKPFDAILNKLIPEL